MAQNVGTVDRALRAVIGISIAIFGWLGLAGVAGIIVTVVGLVLTATALFSVCPAYSILGMNTCEKPDSRGH